MTPRLAAVAAALTAAVATVATPPNDPAWPQEWGPRLTRTTGLWSHTTGSSRVVVAIVDTGVARIPDLRGAVVPGWDFVDGDDTPADTFGHGTWIASIVAARGNNGHGIAGYCWRCSIMPVRVAADEQPASAASVSRGIVWAVDHGARIVNVSLAGRADDASERAAVQYAAAHDVLVVASAGNGGDAVPEYPAALTPALAVAGTDPNDQVYAWSTRGPWVQLAAPGCAALYDAVAGASYGCGSSFAPAAVAGIAGLLLSADPSLSAARLTQALVSTSKPVAGIGGGRVDALAAYEALGLGSAPPPPAGTGRSVSSSTGVVRGSRSVVVSSRAGRIDAQFISRYATSCEMSMRVGPAVVTAFAADARILTLDAVVGAGRHRISIACSPVRVVPYTLAIELPASA